MTSISWEIEQEEDIAVQEAEPKTQVKEPAMYQVLLHNDDFTPMEFVIKVLEIFFNMDVTIATGVMYDIHMKGRAICGIFSKDVAETKVAQVIDYARMHEHPLLSSTEAM